MGRIRTVKPEYFTHEDLYELEIESALPVRVAFAGLFTCCDREGRFKWKPKTLKLAVLPHDILDFSRVLHALWTRGFVWKYEIERVEYGVIPTFLKHQVINNRESASDIPEPTESSYLSITSTREARVNDASSNSESRDDDAGQGEGKGREGKGIRKGREGKETYVKLPLDDSVQTIFDYWRKTMAMPGSILDKKRISLIASALKNYSPADVCKAIRGCSKSPHNMGDNKQKTKYNGLNLILRDAEHIDRFIVLDAGNARPASETFEQHNARVTAEFLGTAQNDDGNTIEMEA